MVVDGPARRVGRLDRLLVSLQRRSGRRDPGFVSSGLLHDSVTGVTYPCRSPLLRADGVPKADTQNSAESRTQRGMSVHRAVPAVDDGRMRVTYDRESDAAYIYLTDATLQPGRDSLPCDKPDGVDHAWVVMDWREGKIVGLEVLDASKLLHADLLALADSH